MSIPSILIRLAQDQRGATAVEYGLILSLIVLAMFTAISGFGNAAKTTWNNVNTQSANAISAANAGG